MDPLAPFTEPTREWFRASFGAPTAAQAGAWESIAAGRSALVVAPTGSGKTLSAFLSALDQLVAEPQQGTTVLYISPLKALGVDIERNLRSPLVGIGHTARRLGQEPSDITVGVRTGDSTPKERRDLVRNPPNILITTPESLYLMLTSQARGTLTNVSTVIVDEVHAMAGTKRGAHLALSLERLDAMLDSPAQRIGLSATVEPKDEVARFLGGGRPVDVVAPQAEKQWDITVTVPVEDLAAPQSASDDGADQPLTPSIWPHVEHRVVELVSARRSTIVFVNSRRLAEKLTGRLNEIHAEKQGRPAPEETVNPDDDGAASRPRSAGSESSDDAVSPELLARAHHGSVSKEQRQVIEEDLKAGRLRCVVATSSLELGIDMGAVDLVVQVEAPHAVSAGLQRLGRAGHHVGEVSIGWFFPKHRGDLVTTAVVVERMLSGQIEALHVPRSPLDILAQQTVAACALEDLDVEEWFETVRRSAPFSSLPRSAYEATLDLLAGKYPSDRFADLRPRIVWDRDAGTMTGRPGAQRLAVTSGGTIPDRGLFGVYLAGGEDAGSSRAGGRRVGELDEEMVYESRIGDVFALGATSWRIEEITFDRVLVTPAFGQPATLPFWRGDGIGRPAELGRALGAFQREIRTGEETAVEQRLTALGLDAWARGNLRRYLDEQHEAVGTLPSDVDLVVEQTRDELGDWRIILHSPYGLQVHAPWALAVGERLHERYGLDGQALASDDGIVLRVPMMDEEPPGAELFAFEPDELEEIVTSQVSASALFAGRFREAAARALLLPRQSPGQRTPLWQQRQRASQLLEVAAGHPDFPMIMEAMREVLQDVYDMPALRELTEQLSARRVRMVEATTAQPSPFAQSILFGYIAQYLYEGDSPLAERRAAALQVDPELLGELLGQVELRDLLDPQVIAEAEAHAQRLAPSRRVRGVEGVADLLRLLGPLTAEELAARMVAEGAGDGDGGRAADDAADAAGDDEHSPVAPPSLDAETTAGHAEQLVAAQRAFRVRWAGEERYAAIEDAARLRDGVGAPLPPGIPQPFLEPVDDPLGDVVSRHARTHGPFTAAEAAAALGLGVGVVEEVLHRLGDERRVVQGRFRPAGDGASGASAPEWCEVEMLRRIRRRSLAALRAEVEPVPTAAYAEFLARWQHAAPRTRVEGAAGLLETISQLAGAAAPASAWESHLLAVRVADYRPQMLDELIASGTVVAVGRGTLSGHDGWLSLLPREDLDAGLLGAGPSGARTEDRDEDRDDGVRAAVRRVLSRGGAWFAEAIADELARGDGAAGPDDPAGPADAGTTTPAPGREQVEEALREMFWDGEVTPDSFQAVRALLSGGRTAHRGPSRPSRTRHATRRTALRRAVAAHRGASAPGGSPGPRWALVPRATPDPTEAAYAEAEVLLDRYGVVTRGSVVAEQQAGGGRRDEGPLAGGFAAMYKVFAAAEEAGRLRRGYFVERLGAAQFTTSATIDQLRAVAEDQEDSRARQDDDGADPERTVVLAATDPANAYGAALDWPEPPRPADQPGAGAGVDGSQARAPHRPGRKAGALVVIHRGDLVLYMERGGRTMLLYTEDEDLMEVVAGALVERLRAAKTARLAVEQVNGAPVLRSAFGAALQRAGFRSSPSGLRFSV